MWTILKLIEWTTEYFTKHSIPNPRLDAELLLSHILNIRRIDLYLSFDKAVKENELALFKGFIQRRIKREPLQYIIGAQDFFGVPIKITADVLIPRPETEILVEECLKLLKHRTIEPSNYRTILDLCTGSGCIIAA
ncbi:MAG: peptide chain release factor N(5)-glutamine methyltransferase, partial [Deltaproteobacteria bacterium]|nr:peptide chain release factor N(5)-glutamine methyltransferase [Deltaproteobacteria bacterium]